MKSIAFDVNKRHKELGIFSEKSINHDNELLTACSTNDHNNIVPSTLSQMPVSNEELNKSNDIFLGRRSNNIDNNNK